MIEAIYGNRKGYFPIGFYIFFSLVLLDGIREQALFCEFQHVSYMQFILSCFCNNVLFCQYGPFATDIQLLVS